MSLMLFQKMSYRSKMGSYTRIFGLDNSQYYNGVTIKAIFYYVNNLRIGFFKKRKLPGKHKIDISHGKMVEVNIIVDKSSGNIIVEFIRDLDDEMEVAYGEYLQTCRGKRRKKILEDDFKKWLCNIDENH